MMESSRATNQALNLSNKLEERFSLLLVVETLQSIILYVKYQSKLVGP